MKEPSFWFYALVLSILLLSTCSKKMSSVKKAKKFNGGPMVSTENNNKRKRGVSKKDDEISSDDDLSLENELNAEESSEDDEQESAQEKRLRLAKIYLEEIRREERNRLDNEEDVSKEVISQRLRDDHLKQIGKYALKVADKYSHYGDLKILKCREQKGCITCMCVSSDNSWLFSGSKDGVVVKWSLKEAKKIGYLPFVKHQEGTKLIGHSSCISSLAISTDNKFLVVADASGAIQVWNPQSLEHVNTLKGHKAAVMGLSFKKDANTLYSCSKDGMVRVWSLDDMTFVETLYGHENMINAIDVLQSDRPITAGGLDGTLRLWKVSEESTLIFNAQPGHVDCVKWIGESNFISGGDDGRVSIWSSLKKKPLCYVAAAHGVDPSEMPFWISSVAALPHSDLAASGSSDGAIRLWKLGDKCRTIEMLFEVPVTGYVNALQFTSDGAYLIAGCGKDHRLARWANIKNAKNCIVLIPLTSRDN